MGIQYMDMKNIIYGVVAALIIIGGFLFFTKSDDKKPEIKIAFAEVAVLEKTVSFGTDEKNLKEISGSTESVGTGSFLKTGDKGRALISLGKAQTSVDYNSLVKIEDKTDEGSILNLKSGKTWSRVEKLLDKGEYHEIKTKNAVASVRGTSFGVYINGEDTTLLVASGTVKFIPLDKNGKEQPQFALYVTEGKKATRIGFGVAKIENITDADKDKFYKWNLERESKLEEKVVEEKKDESIFPKMDYKNIDSDTTPPDAPAPTAPVTTPTNTTTGGGSSSGNAVSSFYLSSISPNVVDVGSGETVSFNGGGFLDATTLIINETSIAFRIVSDSKITIIAGEELPQGIYDVTIVNKSKQETTLKRAFEVRELNKAQNEANVR